MTAKEAWKSLYEQYQPREKPTDQQYENFCRVISAFSDKAIAMAYEHTIEHEKFFPVLALFKAYCEIFKEKIEEEIHQQQKKLEREAIAKHGIFGPTKLAQEVRQIVSGYSTGKLTRRQYIEELKQLNIDCMLMKEWGDDLDIINPRAKMKVIL